MSAFQDPPANKAFQNSEVKYFFHAHDAMTNTALLGEFRHTQAKVWRVIKCSVQ